MRNSHARQGGEILRRAFSIKRRYGAYQNIDSNAEKNASMPSTSPAVRGRMVQRSALPHSARAWVALQLSEPEVTGWLVLRARDRPMSSVGADHIAVQSHCISRDRRRMWTGRWSGRHHQGREWAFGLLWGNARARASLVSATGGARRFAPADRRRCILEACRLRHAMPTDRRHRAGWSRHETDMGPTAPTAHRNGTVGAISGDQARSKRSRLVTLVQAATKSFKNFSPASALA